MPDPEPAEIIEARTAGQVDLVACLFREYVDWLGVDLSFQGFDEELAGLPGIYASPRGQLLLALAASQPAGCVGLRPLEPRICEMKRLYVRPAWRGTGLGRRLAETVIATARAVGYERMRLDTMRSLAAANRLYESLGFVEIEPYTVNPIEGVRFLELRLDR